MPKKSAGEARVADEKRMLAEIGERLGRHTKVTDVHGGDIRDMHRNRSTERTAPRAGKPHSLDRFENCFRCRWSRGAAKICRGETPCSAIRARASSETRRRGGNDFSAKPNSPAISDALAEYPGAAADCVRLIMLTGCRPSEAMRAAWAEFDKEPGYWIKPSAHTKQRKVHKVPLSPPAIELIGRLRKKRRGNVVFPGDKPGEHLAALWHVWHFVRKRTGLGADARIYDLRHTFASVGAGGGLGLPIIGRLLGHTQSPHHATLRPPRR